MILAIVKEWCGLVNMLNVGMQIVKKCCMNNPKFSKYAKVGKKKMCFLVVVD